MKFRFSLRKRNDTEMKIKEKIKRKLLENNAASRRRLFFFSHCRKIFQISRYIIRGISNFRNPLRSFFKIQRGKGGNIYNFTSCAKQENP